MVIQKIVYFSKELDIGRKVTIERVMRSGERRKLAQWPAGSGSRKRFLDVLRAILCEFMHVLVHFES